jgi:hypothetical protein
MNRTTAIIITVVTSVFCGCPGLGTCLWGVIFGIGGAFGTGTVTVNGATQPMDPTMGILTGLGAVCGGIILIAIPIVVGVLTLRNAKQA